MASKKSKLDREKEMILNYISMQGGAVSSAREIINNCCTIESYMRPKYNRIREAIGELVNEGLIIIDDGYYKIKVIA